MALKLMYVTNDVKISQLAENSNVDWIFIDLEINGKEQRQGHLDTVISRHSIDSVKTLKSVLSKSELLVRVNPIFEGSKAEIDKIINDGADIIMLPYFKTKEEVEKFVEIVDGRKKICLLLETPESVENIDSILEVSKIDYIHIGLNDLHLGYGMKFMFELLTDGTVEKLCKKIKQKRITYGFGGIAQLGQGDLPAENIIAEHYRLGSSMAILSRSFLNLSKVTELDEAERTFSEGVKKIREYEAILENKNKDFFENNKLFVQKKVKEIVNR